MGIAPSHLPAVSHTQFDSAIKAQVFVRCPIAILGWRHRNQLHLIQHNQHRQPSQRRPPQESHPWRTQQANGTQFRGDPSWLARSRSSRHHLGHRGFFSSTSGSLESSTADSKKSDSLALKPPRSESEGKIEKPRSPWASLISMVASLCVVIGLFLGLAWTLRRSTGQPFGSLPKEVVQILGRTAMAPRQQVYCCDLVAS